MNILEKQSVLVLNKNWQAVGVKTPAQALPMVYSGVATSLVIDEDNMYPVKWSDWEKLQVRECDQVVHTTTKAIRIPTVIVLASYNQVPKRRPRFSSRAIWVRDNGMCQYTGQKLTPADANIDHVVPRARGGSTSWENCVLSHKKVNSKKADKLPEQVGLSLLKKPSSPRDVPATLLIENRFGIKDWDHFLLK